MKLLGGVEGLACPAPEGALYAWADVSAGLDEGILSFCLPHSCMYGESL